jgi:hypothetical protein
LFVDHPPRNKLNVRICSNLCSFYNRNVSNISRICCKYGAQCGELAKTAYADARGNVYLEQPTSKLKQLHDGIPLDEQDPAALGGRHCGEIVCYHYMKQGSCSRGSSCTCDHPPRTAENI